MKKIVIILLVIIVGLFFLGFIKDQIIKSVVSAVATKLTGARVSIGSFSLGIFHQSVRIREFKMYNPEGFPEGILLYSPGISVSCDLFSLLSGKLHLTLVDVDLKEIGLEKNKEGRLNVDSLRIVQQGQGRESGEKKAARPLAMRIDLLNLQMGRIVYKDYSAGKEPITRVYDINLKKSYKNITSGEQLAALILTEPMKQAGIRGAEIYGVSMLAGVAVMPVAIVATFAGKDSVSQRLEISFGSLYEISLKVLTQSGEVNKEERDRGIITALVDGASLIIKLKKLSPQATQITISARKYMLPKPEIASGVLYKISEQLK